VIEAAPEITALARENRKFLGRAVQFLAGDAGIRQFLDLGTGLPTRGNVHQVAQQVDPGCRVVYVDNDPMVLAYSRALKTGPGTAVIQADMRDPAAILGNPQTHELIDFEQPMAVLFVAVLHFLSDRDDPAAVVARFLGAAAPGSYLVISHATGGTRPQAADLAAAAYASTANPATPRDRQEIRAFFHGTDLIEPGLVPVQLWRQTGPDPVSPDSVGLLGGVGRKLVANRQ
jgi:SAM-dependent methyltransferase